MLECQGKVVGAGRRGMRVVQAKALVVVHGLRWISLPHSGIKPISPAFQRGFLTTGPPRKTPKHKCFCFIHLLVAWDVDRCHGLVNHLL